MPGMQQLINHKKIGHVVGKLGVVRLLANSGPRLNIGARHDTKCSQGSTFQFSSASTSPRGRTCCLHAPISSAWEVVARGSCIQVSAWRGRLQNGFLGLVLELCADPRGQLLPYFPYRISRATSAAYLPHSFVPPSWMSLASPFHSAPEV